MSGQMKLQRVFGAAVLAATSLFASSAMAAATYGNIAAPGVYFGTGNVNGDWTINTDNNIEVALRAKNRATLATIDGSGGEYVSAGGYCNPTCTGSLKAMWNYELSVNVRADGTGTNDLQSFFVRLDVDTDPTAGTSFTTLDVLSNWPDTAYWDGSAPRINRQSPIAGEFGAQQSANPMFGDSGYAGVLPGAGLYELRLTVFANDNGQLGNRLSATSIDVRVLPEPASLTLAGMALMGMGWARRRKA